MSVISQITTPNTSVILPRMKYNAVKGRFYKIERTQTQDGWESSDVALTIPLKLALDFSTMEIGPVAFIANKPDFHLVSIAAVEAGTVKIPVPPTPDHKTSVRVRAYSKELGVREWMVQAKIVLSAIDALYEAAKVAPEYKAGKAPVVSITGTTETKFKTPAGGEGSSEQPIMAITGWTDRKVFEEAMKEAEQADKAPPPPVAEDDTDF